MTRRALILLSIMTATSAVGLRAQGTDPAKGNPFVLEANTPARLGDAVILCGDVKETSVSDVLILRDGKEKGSFSEVIKANSGTVTHTAGAKAVKLKLIDATICRADPNQDRKGPGLMVYRVGEVTVDLPFPPLPLRTQ